MLFESKNVMLFVHYSGCTVCTLVVDSSASYSDITLAVVTDEPIQYSTLLPFYLWKESGVQQCQVYLIFST